MFTVVLDSQPYSSVTVDVSSSNTAEAIVSSSALVFATGDWSSSQTVTVTGVNDDEVDGTAVLAVTLSNGITSDANFQGLVAVDLLVTNTDGKSFRAIFLVFSVHRSLMSDYRALNA